MKKLIPILCLLLAGAFWIGCSENSPTQASADQAATAIEEGVHIQGDELAVAKKPPKCPDWPTCKDDGDDDKAGDTFTVEVFFSEGLAGFAENVVAKTTGRGTSLQNTPMELDITFSTTGLVGCSAISAFSGPTEGQFALSTARIPKSSSTLDVTANFFDFVVGDVGYALTLGPDDDGVITGPWPPANTNDVATISGFELKLREPNDPSACNVIIKQEWKIEVTITQD